MKLSKEQLNKIRSYVMTQAHQLSKQGKYSWSECVKLSWATFYAQSIALDYNHRHSGTSRKANAWISDNKVRLYFNNGREMVEMIDCMTMKPSAVMAASKNVA